ncbi:hypothetical protein ACQ86N_11095 [Puia sp. P3]|uniref:hypothetical protein n=1 Tax=Puia sp. P3 TaxID=3423952 RepID=UPI003D67AEBD
MGFFRTMENAAGEDLGWFWRGWIFSNWKLDQGVKEVRYVQNDPAKGSIITLENREEMVMPVVLAIGQENRASDTLVLPAEIWQRGAVKHIAFRSVSKIRSVVVDPRHEFPDVDSTNNVWRADTTAIKPY